MPYHIVNLQGTILARGDAKRPLAEGMRPLARSGKNISLETEFGTPGGSRVKGALG